jgi:uncharacterized membrane protein
LDRHVPDCLFGALMFDRLHRLDLTWLALIGLAVATILVHFFVPYALFADAAVLVLAAIKGRKIVMDYLGLRTAPALWGRLVSVWVVVVALFAWLASAVVALI